MFCLWNFISSLSLSSLFFFLFSFCSSDWIISNELYSGSLILSSPWSGLLLKLFVEFFSLVIVFFRSRIPVVSVSVLLWFLFVC